MDLEPSGIEKPEINHYMYGHWIFDKDAKTFNRKKQSFQEVVLGIMDVQITEVGPLP